MTSRGARRALIVVLLCGANTNPADLA